MYCKYCGKEISDDSVYCSSCGKKQDGRDSNLKPWIVKYKFYIILYAIWVVIHYALYLYEDSSGISGAGYFYPFTSHIIRNFHGYIDREVGIFDANYYDSTELLVYCVLIPLIIYLIIWKWKSFIYPNKIFFISYTVWLIINLFWWANSRPDYDDPSESFFPFTSKIYNGSIIPMFDASYYDIFEFIVYCILLPLLLFLGIWYFKKRKK